MKVNATVEVDGAFCRMWLTELAGVGSRQVAERDRLVSRLYDAVLDRYVQLTIGLPYWVTDEYGRNVMYPAYQDGRSVRFHRRDGEFYPGLVLERLGMYEGGRPLYLTGAQDFFVGGSAMNAFVTEGLDTYVSIPFLRGKFVGPTAMVGRVIVLGGYEKLYYSDSGYIWNEVGLSDYGEVLALAFDGGNVICACEGGIAVVNWESKNIVWFDQPGPFVGLSAEFDNPEPFRVKPTGTSGVWAIQTLDGADFRTLGDAGNPFDAHFTNNFVRHSEDNRFIVVDRAGVVWEFGQHDLNAIGQVARGDRKALLPASFPIRDIVALVVFGRLCWTEGVEVHEVYDFGGDVGAWPSLLGPIVVRDDGLTYRIRRISYGL